MLCIWMILRYLPEMKWTFETLVPNIRIYNQDVGVNYGTENVIQIMKKGMRETIERKEQPNQESIRTL